MRYSVVVWWKRGGCIAPPHYFDDETKARAYYADCLVKYLDGIVEFSGAEENAAKR